MKKQKKKKKRTSEWYRKKSVELAKKISKTRAKHTCQYCQATNRQMHGSHVFAEGTYKSMSADVDNIICLCGVHHLAHAYWNKANDWSWHGTPAEAVMWFQEKYPEQWETLKLRTQTTRKVNWKKKRETLRKEMIDVLIDEK